MGDLPLSAMKVGRRNNRDDAARLRQIQALIAELLSSEEAEPDEGKSLDLSYVKSIGVATLPELAVKSVGKDEVKGYTFLWGNPEQTDLEREFFTNTTNFWDDILGKSPRPLTWDHAQDKSMKASPVIGQIVEWGNDDVGRWAVSKLDTNHKYRKAVDKLIDEGALGMSSDSAPQYVERVKSGKSTRLAVWPWFASALTPTPCEPRMLDVGSLVWKSIAESLPETRMGAPDGAQVESLKRWFEVLKLSV